MSTTPHSKRHGNRAGSVRPESASGATLGLLPLLHRAVDVAESLHERHSAEGAPSRRHRAAAAAATEAYLSDRLGAFQLLTLVHLLGRLGDAAEPEIAAAHSVRCVR